MKKFDSVLNEVLKRIEPPKEDVEFIERYLKDFIKKFESELNKYKVVADIFVGGSFAKKTIIKKDSYDVDVFVRFDKKYKGEESAILKKLLKNFDKVETIHGSRDYYKVKVSSKFSIELIPVIKVKNPKESDNITDLSYSHVNYVKKKVKSKRLLQEIKLAKAFCYANHCYGAESYVQGFSGYALELLGYSYGGFIKFLKGLSKRKKKDKGKYSGVWTKEYEEKYKDMKNKIVIDIEKAYKNKAMVLMDLNGSKLNSPVVLIDPTFKGRNVTAALSYETFEKFKESAKYFLKEPKIESFEIQKTDLEKIEKEAKENNFEFILLQAITGKQEGDIAGSKLLKFYKH
jgi:tRNA CCA-adding enzyme